MPFNQQLIPVSFHLRNFNKYHQLDLPASKNGNLTLIGENAVGKTTLANCFFPMLIDGAISTPSFNPAKGTDKLGQSINPRNSARDTRNFEGMLLGWGAGAMKVRTGYSYILWQSDQRQLITGIGAYRAQGATRKPTWWFVASQEGLEPKLEIVTTDDTGKSLGRDEFIAQNRHLGEQLKVYDRAEDYRDYVANHVYGFTSEALGKLANVYRLLASPILTAGNAKFTPIREALRTAQEGIDPQVINDVAESQREVNRMNGILTRVQRAQDRLQKLQQELFWRNLNHLQELRLQPYSERHHQYEDHRKKFESTGDQIQQLSTQQQLTSQNLLDTQTQLAAMQKQKAEQEYVIERKHQYESQISQAKRELDKYRKEARHKTALQQQVGELTQQLTKLNQQAQELDERQLKPLQASLDAKTANLQELAAMVAEVTVAGTQHQLAQYLQLMQRLITKHQSLTEMIDHLDANMKVVAGMQGDLDIRIDQRLTNPMTSRARGHLHEDNREIHQAGMAKMNEQFITLNKQRADLIVDHGDLKRLLGHQERIDELQTINSQLQTYLQDSDAVQTQIKERTIKQTGLDEELAQLNRMMDPNFNIDDQEARIKELQRQSDALKIDLQLDVRMAETSTALQKFTADNNTLIKKISEQRGIQNESQAAMGQDEQVLADMKAQISRALTALTPYMADDQHLTNVAEAVAFVHANGSRVRNSNYAGISAQVSRLIHDNDSNGVDQYALDNLFEERGYTEMVGLMRGKRVAQNGDMVTVTFDIAEAQRLMRADEKDVQRSLETLTTGNDLAQIVYTEAVIDRIASQYRLINEYNQMLAEGGRAQKIHLKVTLRPDTVTQTVIDEARDLQREERPALQDEIARRLEKLANNPDTADDDDEFYRAAQLSLDTRQWSNFVVLIKRRQNGDYEEVDDKFVQSGGSGAEKSQAMVLPLLLVPKMVLQRASRADAPGLVMFDEFADKLDPETAKAFANTITNFGFNFIATMPSGAQNKILADGVENIAYDVIAPQTQDDGRFHKNIVRPALIWQMARDHE